MVKPTLEGAYVFIGSFYAGANISSTYDITNKRFNNPNWGVSTGIGYGKERGGIGLYVGYGSGGLSYGIGGNHNIYSTNLNKTERENMLPEISVPEIEINSLVLDLNQYCTEINDLNNHFMELYRFISTNESTIRIFVIDNGKITGFFSEPPGPSSTVSESGLRIMEGVYQLRSYSCNRLPNHFEVQGVSGITHILIHGDTGPQHTSGCLIIGNHVGNNSISAWRPMMNELRTYIFTNGGARNILIII